MSASNRSAIEPGKLREMPTLSLTGLGTGNRADNIHHLMRAVSISQSIYLPYVQTRLTLNDGAALHEKILPVLGEERLKINMTDSGGRTMDVRSYMHTSSDQVPYQNHRSLVYIMQGVNYWYHNNLRDKVRKTFHDMTYTDMISAIASEYLEK